MEMVNGYVFLDLTKSNVYAKALKVLGAEKPVIIKDSSGVPYFVDSIALDGTNVVITKNGKTITIANDNTVTSTGIVSAPTMENIVDLAGNKRFIEGEISVITELEGLTDIYKKWSLSGSHLMIVISGKIDNNTVVGANDYYKVELPDWIADKIATVANRQVDRKSIALTASNYSVQNAYMSLVKDSNGVGIYIEAVTLTADRYFRCQFDLLIDAE